MLLVWRAREPKTLERYQVRGDRVYDVNKITGRNDWQNRAGLLLYTFHEMTEPTYDEKQREHIAAEDEWYQQHPYEERPEDPVAVAQEAAAAAPVPDSPVISEQGADSDYGTPESGASSSSLPPLVTPTPPGTPAAPAAPSTPTTPGGLGRVANTMADAALSHLGGQLGGAIGGAVAGTLGAQIGEYAGSQLGSQASQAMGEAVASSRLPSRLITVLKI